MDALELEHLEEEKLTAAIQQGAGRKAIEVVRAEKSVQMKSVLAELNMEHLRYFRSVILKVPSFRH